MNKAFSNAELTDLIESDNSQHPYSFEVRQFITLNPLDNKSTWALAYSNAKRLSLRGMDGNYEQQANSISSKITRLAISAPLLSIDLLTHSALLERKTVYFKAPTDPALLAAALPLHCQLIMLTDQITLPNASEDLTSLQPGQAIVMERDQVIGIAKNVKNLLNLLR